MRPRGIRLALLLTPALGVVGVFFVAGVVQVVAQSLGYLPFLQGWHWSTDAYRQLLADPAVRSSLLITARVSATATVLAAVLGVTAALLVLRLGQGRGWATGLLQTNLAVPHLVGALCMLLLLGQSGLLSRLTHAAGLTGAPASFPALTADQQGIGIIAEYVWKEAPFIAVLALGALNRGSDELDRAARALGATRWQRLAHVTLPLLAPTVSAGSLFVFAFTLGSYEVPYLLGRPFPATLPVVAYQTYSATDLTTRPEAMAMAVLITLVSLAVVGAYLSLASRLGRRAL